MFRLNGKISLAVGRTEVHVALHIIPLRIESDKAEDFVFQNRPAKSESREYVASVPDEPADSSGDQPRQCMDSR